MHPVRILLVVLILVLIVRLIQEILSSGRKKGDSKPDFPCKTCRHCGILYDDGVLCQYGGDRIFKAPRTIFSCRVYQKL